MTKHLVFLAAIATLAAAPAFAAAPQVFVSSRGANAATCGTPAAPCRTFQHAHDVAVTAGGVISVMDSGEYGPVRITKSVSIVNNGAGVASVSVTAPSTAIQIDAPAGVVVLRGLTLDGGDVQSIGVVTFNAKALDISKCVFRNFRERGVVVAGRTPLSFKIADSEVTNSALGVVVEAAVPIDGVINNSRFNDNGTGVFALNAFRPVTTPIANVVVKDSAANGGSTAFTANATAPNISLTLAGVSVNGSSIGAQAALAGTVRLARSTITGSNDPAVGVTSSGDNHVAASVNAPTSTLVPMR